MYVSVRVMAGARRESVEELKNGRLKISVKEPAEQNRANRRALELVAAHFHVLKSRVRLISGHTAPSKLFSIEA